MGALGTMGGLYGPQSKHISTVKNPTRASNTSPFYSLSIITWGSRGMYLVSDIDGGLQILSWPLLSVFTPLLGAGPEDDSEADQF